jgi:hypothetical protein
MKQYLFILCLVTGFKLKSQDTIVFKNSNLKSVKVLEVSSSEIKYKFFNDSASPLFISPLYEINFIRYRNGLIDSFYSEKPIVHNVSSDNNIVIKYKYDYTNEKIVIEKNNLFYEGKKLKDKELYYLINNYPKNDTKLLLNKEFSNMKSNHRKQFIFGFFGLGAAIVAPFQGIAASIATNDESFLFVGLASGITLGVSGLVISSVNKHYYKKRRLKIANAYNTNP